MGCPLFLFFFKQIVGDYRMKKNFTINGKKYTAKPITFNALCDFEDMGFNIEELFDKKMKGMRVYLAYCGDMDIEAAGAELEAHLMSGKNITDLSDALVEAVQESGFFHAFTAETEESNQESEGEAKEK